MPERKVWTEAQDKILKLLRQERKEKKWAHIARIMEKEFQIKGRTGKQCRQRYHNHLDSTIVNSEWNQDEEEKLYDLHEEIGNKWSAIAQKIPGRSDNCVKNHFYSKLRKAVRKINKIIQDIYHNEYTTIKNCMLSKIIEITQSKFKNDSKLDQQFVNLCNKIKNRLFKLEVSDREEMNQQDQYACKQIIQDIEKFDKIYRKTHKSSKKYQAQEQYKIYLKPPKSNFIKRQNSHGSNSSEFSDQGSSYLSSSSFISSCSDLSQYDNGEKKHLSSANSTGSFRHSPVGSSQNIKIQCEQKINEIQNPSQFQRFNEHLIEQQNQNQDLNQQMRSQSFQINNMFYDDTPLMARILGPASSYSRMDQQPQSGLFGRKQSDEEIVYNQEKSQK